ncbi:O-antigen ligase family protein [uncultured Microbacterium sp.]|uniref:O-antigen ligase family protein n=1 Tax=uncultured Microbacterium sp. TaxID=191216 RepID=UPI00262F5FDA|nr:O-antigen ligase family protein [uncultured Microbacterium sp.]
MTTLTRVYAFVLMFSALAYSFWYNLLGPVGTSILLLAMAAITAALTPVWRSRLAGRTRSWRAQPWPLIAYAALGALSIVWSSWPLATAITWVMMALFTAHGILFARAFTREELLTTLERALGAILVLSLALEAWVALVLRHPILPNFSDAPEDPNPHWYWVRGNLFDDLLVGSRIQGIVGNANLLAVLCVLALIVFATRFARRAPHTGARVVLSVLALWLCVRSGSAAMFLTLAAVGAAALIVLLFRRFTGRRARTTLYAAAITIVVAVVAGLLIAKDSLLALLGRSSDITGRTEIWAKVLERAVDSPLIGHGFASPWLPWDSAFDGWIMDHGITVFHSHNMWIDGFLQLGALGILLLITIYATTLWRSWRLAISADAATRSMAPLLLVLVLLVQGLSESAPLMFWGWMLISGLYTFVMPCAAEEETVAADQLGSGSSR